jgi:hypothetical protein
MNEKKRDEPENNLAEVEMTYRCFSASDEADDGLYTQETPNIKDEIGWIPELKPRRIVVIWLRVDWITPLSALQARRCPMESDACPRWTCASHAPMAPSG